MSDRLYLGTRKGLFTFDRTPGTAGRWSLSKVDFLGDQVNMLLRDPRHNTLYAALMLAHFGAKLRRSTDDGKTWDECAVPVYPEGEIIARNVPPGITPPP